MNYEELRKAFLEKFEKNEIGFSSKEYVAMMDAAFEEIRKQKVEWVPKGHPKRHAFKFPPINITQEYETALFPNTVSRIMLDMADAAVTGRVKVRKYD